MWNNLEKYKSYSNAKYFNSLIYQIQNSMKHLFIMLPFTRSYIPLGHYVVFIYIFMKLNFVYVKL